MSWFKKIETEADKVAHDVEQYVSGIVSTLHGDIEKLVHRLEGKKNVLISHGGQINKDGTGQITIGVEIKPAAAPSVAETNTVGSTPAPDPNAKPEVTT